MMKKSPSRKNRLIPLRIAFLFVFLGILALVFFPNPTIQSRIGREWKTLIREGKRILGWGRNEIPPEEKRIREGMVLKKMEEATANQDWRLLDPEYPRPKRVDPPTGEGGMKALKNSPEFKEMDKELKEYLKKKEDLLFNPEPPIPSLKDAADFTHLRDRGAEKIVEKLLGPKEKAAQEKPLEENLLLGIKGPLAARKIIGRPRPPQVKVQVEAEIEMMLYVLPNGIVDRVIPSVKGDAELERIAMQYLKEWRFVPLPKDQPQVEQWGTIPMKFKLQ
jgi:TonB family protein